MSTNDIEPLLIEEDFINCCNGRSWVENSCYIMYYVFIAGTIFCFTFGIITLKFFDISIFIFIVGTLSCMFCLSITFCWLNTQEL